MDRLFFSAGAISAAIAVVAGAFAAHGLKSRLSAEMLAVFETAARYHLIHSIALIAVSWAISKWPGNLSVWSGWAFLSGVIIFSGSLYALSLSGIKILGAITPIGGVALIIAWVLLGLTPFFR